MNKNIEEKLRNILEIKQLEDFEHDNLLFKDPYRINEKDGELAQRAKTKILKYFDIFFEAIKEGDREKVLNIGEHLHEINATRLGFTSKDTFPKGKGFSQKDLVKIYDAARDVEDCITDMPDVFVLAENVGPDKVSDITTNIIYEELLEFTKNIIKKYKLDLECKLVKKYVYDVFEEKWIKKSINVPMIDGKEILFLPSNIVERYEIFSYETFYRNLVYPFYKTNTAIHHLIRFLKNNEEKPDCKRIKEKYPLKRETVKEFKKKFQKEYEEYKEKVQKYYWMQ